MTDALRQMLRSLTYGLTRRVVPERWQIRSARLANGHRLSIDPVARDIGHSVAVAGAWEPEITAIIRDALPEGGVFVDIGANIGYFPVAVADIVGPHGQVFAFEPNVRLFAILEENFAANALPGACHKYALGRTDYSSELWANEQFSGGGYLTNCPSGEEPALGLSAQPVEVRTLDSFALPPVDVMKIDVEGFEPEVLAGADATIARSPAMVLVMEFSPSGWQGQGHDPAAVLRQLRAMGFGAIAILTSSGTHQDCSDDDLLALAAGSQTMPSIVTRRGDL